MLEYFEINIFFHYHLESRSTNISYLDFSLKPSVFGCLTNAIAPLPIALESCSHTQKIGQVF